MCGRNRRGDGGCVAETGGVMEGVWQKQEG